jgi:hypothetical protein
VIGQFDAYPYSFPGDDVVLYVDPADGRIDFLPHGADETFAAPDRPIDYVFGLVAQRCLADPDCEWAWSMAVWDAADAIAAADVQGYADELAARIRPDVVADPRRPYAAADVELAQDAVLDWLARRGDELAFMDLDPR